MSTKYKVCDHDEDIGPMPETAMRTLHAMVVLEARGASSVDEADLLAYMNSYEGRRAWAATLPKLEGVGMVLPDPPP